MKQVTDKAFTKYGRVLELDCREISTVMETSTPLPDDVVYTPSESRLEKLSAFKVLEEEIYGGMPIQFGYCNGDNHLLNAVEYHRSSEVDIAITDLILILGWQPDVDLKDYSYDTGKMEMFFVPAGTTVELYATTLHYAPCSAAGGKFRCGIVLPKGTNEELKVRLEKKGENKLLFAVNKWLIAHKESGLETVGAFIGLTGKNLKA
ncbi:protein of unknown function [Propionispira arboris]|uniref:DUF4867 domain-containing protein n=1 Tax=Propionispira arboris TaxID=84035 RepID=A0A1H7CA47_9FIRM|nr:DUF4867 family protein [Propionispira arboris]SEJ82525.1 protein of unknown function [Propionispira arboris]